MAIPLLPVIGYSLIIHLARKICQESRKRDNHFKKTMTAAEYARLQDACDALEALLALIPFGG